jgi:hypothetical protein
VTSVRLLALVPAVMRFTAGLPSLWHFGLEAHPVHSMGSRSLPRPRFAHTMRSGAGFSNLLAIAYDYDVLGLGPDSPWDDWRCPGTLRRSVWMVRTSITLLIPAFALVRAPPVLAVWLLRSHNAPLPMLARPRSFSRTSDGTKHSTASVRCLSLATLSVHAHSTSELLRTLSMMAASKPTSWLSSRTHSL